jgi:hypothetical protein
VALIGTGLVIGRLIPPLIVRLDGNVPRLSWAAPLTLLLAAILVGRFAWNMWQALHKKHERMTSEHGIRMLAIAKSCVFVGSLVAGVYGGFALAYVDAMDSPLGKERVVRGSAATCSTRLGAAAAPPRTTRSLPSGESMASMKASAKPP